jgi:hypothetical protein
MPATGCVQDVLDFLLSLYSKESVGTPEEITDLHSLLLSVVDSDLDTDLATFQLTGTTFYDNFLRRLLLPAAAPVVSSLQRCESTALARARQVSSNLTTSIGSISLSMEPEEIWDFLGHVHESMRSGVWQEDSEQDFEQAKLVSTALRTLISTQFRHLYIQPTLY